MNELVYCFGFFVICELTCLTGKGNIVRLTQMCIYTSEKENYYLDTEVISFRVTRPIVDEYHHETVRYFAIRAKLQKYSRDTSHMQLNQPIEKMTNFEILKKVFSYNMYPRFKCRSSDSYGINFKKIYLGYVS